jgi:hypothetical protein
MTEGKAVLGRSAGAEPQALSKNATPAPTNQGNERRKILDTCGKYEGKSRSKSHTDIRTYRLQMGMRFIPALKRFVCWYKTNIGLAFF